MDREQIIRDDFPTARRGWQPEAVRAHLIAIADSRSRDEPEVTPTASAAASERVRDLIAAAEEAAAGIVADAEDEAERIRAAAAAEADEIRAAARAESEAAVAAASRDESGRIERARGAVEGLVAQADRLRAQVGELGRDLAANVPGAGRKAGELQGRSGPAPEGAEDAGSEAASAEAAVELEDETSEAAGEPTVDAPGAAGGPEAEAGASAAAADGPIGTGDQGAARLVAMNMALDGAERGTIAAHLRAEFGELPDVEALIDEVLSRAER